MNDLKEAIHQARSVAPDDNIASEIDVIQSKFEWLETVLCEAAEPFQDIMGLIKPKAKKPKWPKDERLLEMVNETSYAATARKIGVSPSTIKKRCDEIRINFSNANVAHMRILANKRKITRIKK